MATSSEDARRALRERLDARLADSPGATWLAENGAVTDLDAVGGLLGTFPRGAARKHLVGAFAERATARLDGVWGALAIGEWTLDEAVRILLLAQAADASDDAYDALFRAYDQGDTETRVAALRALNLVRRGEPERGLDLVRDAGRTYLPQLMGAAWCENPFTSANLPDHDYRKAVLKAFFCDVPVEGFLGLDERADADLASSLCEYIDERLAAGRPVPGAIWPIAALHPQPGLVARLIGNLEHPDRDERLIAARALGNARDGRALAFVRERAEREDDAEVRAALDAARARIESGEAKSEGSS